MIGPKRPKMTAAESKLNYQQVAARSGGVCEFCGQAPAEQMHHRLHRSHGGDEAVWNLLHLCHKCHHRAHYHTDRYDDGLAVRSGFDPMTTPVLYRTRWRVHLG